MLYKKYDIIKSIVIACVVTMLFSCQFDQKEDTAYRDFEEAPIAEGYEVNLKYTDSGKLMAVLKTPKVLDYSIKFFAYF